MKAQTLLLSCLATGMSMNVTAQDKKQPNNNKQRHMKRISYLLEEHRTFMVIRIKGR